MHANGIRREPRVRALGGGSGYFRTEHYPDRRARTEKGARKKEENSFIQRARVAIVVNELFYLLDRTIRSQQGAR